MVGKISGMVMELKEERDWETKKPLDTVTAVIFQKGQEGLLKVKYVPSEVVEEGLMVEELPVKVRMYTVENKTGMTVSYAG